MKYLAILALVLSGCATGPTEYRQGCTAGMNYVIDQFNAKSIPAGIEEACGNLEQEKLDAESAADGSNRPGGRSNK